MYANPRSNTAVLATRHALTLGDYAGRIRTVTRNGEIVATVRDIRDARNPYADTMYIVTPAGVPAFVGGRRVDTYGVVDAVVAMVAARDAHLAAEAAVLANYVPLPADGVAFMDALLVG